MAPRPRAAQGGENCLQIELVPFQAPFRFKLQKVILFFSRDPHLPNENIVFGVHFCYDNDSARLCVIETILAAFEVNYIDVKAFNISILQAFFFFNITRLKNGNLSQQFVFI